MAELTAFQVSLIAVKAELEASKRRLTGQEWATLLDIVQRFTEYELGEGDLATITEASSAHRPRVPHPGIRPGAIVEAP